MNEADAAEAVATRLGALMDSLHFALASTQSLLQPSSEALSHLHTLRSAISKSQVAAHAGIPDRLCHAIFSLLQTLGVCVEFIDVYLQLQPQQGQCTDASDAERVPSSFVEAVFTRAASPQLMPTPPARNDALLNNLLALLNLISASSSCTGSASVALSASGPPTRGWKLLFESLLLLLEQLCVRPETAFVPAERWRAPSALLELLSELVRLLSLLETSANRDSLRPAVRLVELAIITILRTLRIPMPMLIRRIVLSSPNVSNSLISVLFRDGSNTSHTTLDNYRSIIISFANVADLIISHLLKSFRNFRVYLCLISNKCLPLFVRCLSFDTCAVHSDGRS